MKISQIPILTLPTPYPKQALTKTISGVASSVKREKRPPNISQICASSRQSSFYQTTSSSALKELLTTAALPIAFISPPASKSTLEYRLSHIEKDMFAFEHVFFIVKYIRARQLRFLIWKAYLKATAAVCSVFHRHVAAVYVNYLLDKGKSESVSLSLVGAIPLEKLIKNMLLCLFVDTATAIGYCKYCSAVSCECAIWL